MKIVKMFFLFCIVLLLVGCSKNPTSPEKKEFYSEDFYVEDIGILGLPSIYKDYPDIEIDVILRNFSDLILHNPFLIVKCFKHREDLPDKLIGKAITETPSRSIAPQGVRSISVMIHLFPRETKYKDVDVMEIIPSCDEGQGTKFKKEVSWEK